MMQRGGSGNRGRGGYRGGRGQGAGANRGRGGLPRIDNVSGIPPAPKTPLSDPFIMPFQRLTQKNDRGFTLDEELLRAVISQFTVTATGNMEFKTLYENLRQNYPELMTAIYNSEVHFWAYLRCYPEHFGIDMDPRYPWNIWYLSKCKIVAKADRHRYQREFADGTIRPVPDIEMVLNNIRYDINLEKRAASYFYALFIQVAAMGPEFAVPQDIKKVAMAFRPAYGVPPDVCAYVGEVDDYMCKRYHFYNIFGNQAMMREDPYMVTVRKLTEVLKRKGQPRNGPRGRRITCTLSDFYEVFRDPREFDDNDYRAIEIGDMFSFDDFLNFLFMHKLLFRMYTRENFVELRHDVMPALTINDTRSIPAFKNLGDVFVLEESPFGAMAASIGPHVLHLSKKNGALVAASDDDDDGDDELDIDYDDGLPYGPFFKPPQAVPPPQPLRRESQPSAAATEQVSAGRGIATSAGTSAAPRASNVLETFNGFLSRNGNQSNAGGAVDRDGDQLSAVTTNQLNVTQNADVAPRRFVLRCGARPPRASARCRPHPAIGRQALAATGNLPNPNLPPGCETGVNVGSVDRA